VAERYVKEEAIIFDGSWSFGSGAILAPATIGSNQDDYNPTGWLDSGVVQVVGLQLNASTSVDLTGLAAPTDGKTYMVFINNTGTDTITLKNNDGSSSAANRFLFSSDVSLDGEEGIWMYYSQTDSRWREIARAI
jgi:hypothetical protein